MYCRVNSTITLNRRYFFTFINNGKLGKKSLKAVGTTQVDISNDEDSITANKRNRPALATRSEPVVYKLIQSCLKFSTSSRTPPLETFCRHIETSCGPFFDTGGACFDFREATVAKKVNILLSNSATMKQIIEIPDFLLQNVEQIERRISYLRRRGVPKIFPAMLHHSLMEGNRIRPYEKECLTYLDVMASSKAETHSEFLVNNLSSPSNSFDMTSASLIVANHFLRTCHCILLLNNKLQFVRSQQIDIDHVTINLSNFFMRSLQTIKQRCEMLDDAKLPLNLAAILSTYTAFKHWFELGRSGREALRVHDETNSKRFNDRFDLFASMLQTSRDQILSFNFIRTRHLAQLTRLLKLLLENGVKPSEVLSHSYVFEYRPVPRLLDAADYLISKGLTPFTLTQLEKLSIDGRLVRPYTTISRVMGLAKALKCPANELTRLIPMESKKAMPNYFTAQKRIKFLESQGFNVEQIRKCPLILLYDEEKIKGHLDSLATKPEMKPFFERWSEDKQKILGAVEYFCERETNFSLPVTPPL